MGSGANQAFTLTGETTPVPEPLSAGLVAIGLLALLHRGPGGSQRRR
jgi:hypothetical protein